LHNALEFGRLDYTPGGIAGRIQNYELRPRRDYLLDLIGVQKESCFFSLNKHGHPAGENNDLGKRYPVRLGHQDFIARINQANDCVKDCLLATGGGHYL
jgi:hypothetical protein